MPGTGPKTVHVDPKGGDVSMEIFIGEIQYGKYTVEISGDNGGNPISACKGEIRNEISAECQITGPSAETGINEAADLVDRTIVWELNIGTVDEPKTSKYFAKVTFLQAGNVVRESPFEYQGDLDRAKIVADDAMFAS